MTLDFRVLIGEIWEKGVGTSHSGDREQEQDYVARRLLHL
jgi:hypothetical protein